MKAEHPTEKGFSIHVGGTYASGQELRHVRLLHRLPTGLAVTWDSREGHDYWESHRHVLARPCGTMPMGRFVDWAQREVQR